MNHYEKLIEYIINEQEDKARELFHQIVVEKSREIYENLIDEENFEEDQVEDLVDEVDADQEGMAEANDDDMGDMEADMDDMEADMDDMGGDDMGEPGDDMGGEEGEGELEDRVMDLEAALDELKAEFDALMADEANEPEHADMDMPKEEGFDPAMVREYVEKVATPANQEGHTVGTGASAKPAVNAKSPVAGKNDMGGSSANIAKGGSEQAADGKPMPKPSNEYTKGQGKVKHADQFQNVPGAKTKGYAEKKSAEHSEHAVNAKSPIAK